MLRVHEFSTSEWIEQQVTPQQCRMARAALRWTISELAEEAGVGRASVARFEIGEPVGLQLISSMRQAFEGHRVRFLETGQFAGGVYRTSAS